MLIQDRLQLGCTNVQVQVEGKMPLFGESIQPADRGCVVGRRLRGKERDHAQPSMVAFTEGAAEHFGNWRQVLVRETKGVQWCSIMLAGDSWEINLASTTARFIWPLSWPILRPALLPGLQ